MGGTGNVGELQHEVVGARVVVHQEDRNLRGAHGLVEISASAGHVKQQAKQNTASSDTHWEEATTSGPGELPASKLSIRAGLTCVRIRGQVP